MSVTDGHVVHPTREQRVQNGLAARRVTPVESLAELADAGVISLCGEDVPCGSFAAQALESAGVTVPEGSVTRGQNAKATLTAVSEGDAVAGIVYVTDALAAAKTKKPDGTTVSVFANDPGLVADLVEALDPDEAVEPSPPEPETMPDDPLCA